MAYIHKELNFEHKKQLINLLYKGFNRSKSFWESSIEMLISYQMSIDDKKIGFGLFLNDKLVGAMIIINDRSNNTASLSSLYVMQAHRAETLSFLKKAIDSIDQNQINDFSATKDAEKIFKIFGFNLKKEYCNIRIPVPILSEVNIKKLNEDRAKDILIEKKIFKSKNLRVLKLKNRESEKIIILKDFSLLKNGYLRILSSIIYSDALNQKEFQSLVFYNFMRGKFQFDFFDSALSPSIKSKRFNILSKGDKDITYFGNSEYSIFDF